MLEKFLFWLLPRIPKSFISQQARKPSGLFGRIVMAPMFEKGNKRLLDFILTTTTIKDTDHILDVGFGPGTLFAALIPQVPNGKVYGADFSKDMVRVASQTFKKHIDAGTLELKEGSIDSIPYPDNTFDKVFTANTIYFWPHPEANAKELFRVLKPGGTLIIGLRIAEQLATTGMDRNVFTWYTLEQVQALLAKAGFVQMESKSHKETPPIFDSYAMLAKKP